MMKKIAYLLIFITIYSNHRINAMDQTKSQTHLIIIPGQNEDGGKHAINTLPYFAGKINYTHKVATPNIIIDFGQNRCQSYLKETLNSLDKNAKVIIHASSQGTATALNYASKYPEKIGALILEAPMISGNSVIFHTVAHNVLPFLNYIPGSYYALSYLAKYWPIYLTYSPAGEQPIFNIDKLPQNLPIIILHHKHDPQISYHDAEALYAFLKNTQKNNNAYLMSKDSNWAEHIDLLWNLEDEHNLHKAYTINQILEKHHLLLAAIKKDKVPVNTNFDYQPEPKKEWLDHFENLRTKETIMWYINWPIKIIAYSLLLYRLIYKINTINQIITTLPIIPFIW